MPLSRRRRHCTALVDMVSMGSPPKKLKARAGTYFEISTLEKPLKALKTRGITDVQVTVDMDGVGDSPGSAAGFQKFVDAVTKQLKETVVVDNRTPMARFAAEWNERKYYNVVVRRLFASWSATPDGKASVKRATRALKDKLSNETISDFVSESKFTCQRLTQARDGINGKAEEALEVRLKHVEEVAGDVLVPSLPGTGYIDILNYISDANESVHKEFQEEELEAIQAEAQELFTADGSQWVKYFAKDLSNYYRGKKN